MIAHRKEQRKKSKKPLLKKQKKENFYFIPFSLSTILVDDNCNLPICFLTKLGHILMMRFFKNLFD